MLNKVRMAFMSSLENELGKQKRYSCSEGRK